MARYNNEAGTSFERGKASHGDIICTSCSSRLFCAADRSLISTAQTGDHIVQMERNHVSPRSLSCSELSLHVAPAISRNGKVSMLSSSWALTFGFLPFVTARQLLHILQIRGSQRSRSAQPGNFSLLQVA